MFQHSALPTATVDLPQTLRPTGSVRLLNRAAQWIPLPRTAREYLVWAIVMSAVAGLVALQIWLSLQIAQARQMIVGLQHEYTVVEQENAELLWQISQYTALDRIQIEATRMGFVPSLQREYRWSEPATQGAQQATAPAVNAPPPSTTASNPLSQALPWHTQLTETVEAWWSVQAEAILPTWQRWTSGLRDSLRGQ